MSATKGSCYCEQAVIEYTGEPDSIAVCHCTDCRKISGAVWALDVLVDAKNLRVVSEESSIKEYVRTMDSGRTMTSCFCPTCGTTLFRYGDSFGGRQGKLIVKGGVVSNVYDLTNLKPNKEVFTCRRLSWVPVMESIDQFTTMPPRK